MNPHVRLVPAVFRDTARRIADEVPLAEFVDRKAKVKRQKVKVNAGRTARRIGVPS
jgi:hypothetical protein